MSDKDDPPFTKLPNAIIAHLPNMREAELKVVIAIARETLGWGRKRIKLSISRLATLTGMSRPGVMRGIEAGIARGVMGREAEGQGFIYFLLVNDVDQSKPQVVNDVDQLEGELVNEVDQTSKQRLPELVNNVDYIQRKKETNKENDLPEKAVAAVEGGVGGESAPAAAKAKAIKTPKRKDPLTDHPAVQVYLAVNRKPNLHQLEAIADAVGSSPAETDKWQGVCNAWLLRGYSEGNVRGMLDWYQNGIPASANGSYGGARPPPDFFGDAPQGQTGADLTDYW